MACCYEGVDDKDHVDHDKKCQYFDDHSIENDLYLFHILLKEK